MSDSIKEQISKALEARLKAVQSGSVNGTHTYINSLNYVDRQYYNFTEEDVERNPMPWLILNCDSEKFGPLPSARYDNTIFYTLVGITKASKETPDLDSIMNSLQKDVLVAILTDTNLSGIASQVIVRSIDTVSEMIWPFGGFILSLEINYSFRGANV